VYDAVITAGPAGADDVVDGAIGLEDETEAGEVPALSCDALPEVLPPLQPAASTAAAPRTATTPS